MLIIKTFSFHSLSFCIHSFIPAVFLLNREIEIAVCCSLDHISGFPYSECVKRSFGDLQKNVTHWIQCFGVLKCLTWGIQEIRRENLFSLVFLSQFK